MKYFTIAELSKSGDASARGIDNTPNATVTSAIIETIENLLDPIREVFGQPIKVTSGYRCPTLNRVEKGSTSSAHLYGYAADIKPVNGNMKALQDCVLNWAKTHEFDQIIIEQPNAYGVASWIHVGWKNGPRGLQRRQIMKGVKVNGVWNYTFI